MLKFKTVRSTFAYLSSNLLNEVGLSLFRYFEVGLRVCDIVVKKFTFAISSPDEFLSKVLTAVTRVGICPVSVGFSRRYLKSQLSNLTDKCYRMSPGNTFILGLKDQRSRSQLCVGLQTMQSCHCCCSSKLCYWFQVFPCCSASAQAVLAKLVFPASLPPHMLSLLLAAGCRIFLGCFFALL